MHKNKLYVDLTFIASALFAISLPFSILLCNVAIILLCLNTIFFRPVTKINFGKTNSKMLFLFIAIYIWQLIGLLNTDNVPEGINYLILNLPVLIFPLIFYFSKLNSSHFFKRILFLFVFSCCVGSLFNLVFVLIKYYITNDPDILQYSRYSVWLPQAVYFSMYLNFCVIILLHYSNSFLSGNFRRKVLFYGLLIWITVSVFILSSRMGILSLSLIYAFFIFNYFYKRKKLLKGGFFILALCVVFVGAVLSIPKLKNRFLRPNWDYQIDKYRKIKWTMALNIIKSDEYFLLGVGTGDANDHLLSEYRKNKYFWLAEQKYNAHNEYLQTAVRNGILGLLLLLTCLICPIIISRYRKNLLYFGFATLFSLSILTESMLSRQSGVAFYAFFNSFLFFSQKNEEDKLTRNG